MFLWGVTPWGNELYWGNDGDVLFRSALVTHALDSSPASGSQGREGKVYSLLYKANCGHYLLPAWTHGLQGWCNALITYNAWCKTTSILTGTLLSTLLWYLLLATHDLWAGSFGDESYYELLKMASTSRHNSWMESLSPVSCPGMNYVWGLFPFSPSLSSCQLSAFMQNIFLISLSLPSCHSECQHSTFVYVHGI